MNGRRSILGYPCSPWEEHMMTFKEYIEKFGDEELYDYTEVDEVTKRNLLNYFQIEEICAKPEIFAQLYNRSIMLYYPIYEDQMNFWMERKKLEWLHDLVDKETKQHYGEFHMDEASIRDFGRNLTRTINETLDGTSNTNTTFTGKADRKGNSTTDADGSSSNSHEGKGRVFRFNYPESNYQAGVIPYDLDNNPNAEFIDTQQDSVDRYSESREYNDHSETDSTDTTETNNSGTSDTDTTSDRDISHEEGIKDKEGKNGNRDTNDHYFDTWIHDRGDLEKIAMAILDELPRTNFFEQFVNKMSICFRHIYFSGDIWEDMGWR